MELHIPNLDTFGISRTRGFLSSNPPLTAFRQVDYVKWDELVARLPKLVSSHTLYQEIHALPLLNTSKLSSELDYRRAYVVLAFLVHAYVWGGSEDGKPIETIPPQLAEPFLTVCESVGMQPVLSYAGLCLWNWKRNNDGGTSEESFFELSQLESLTSFLGIRGEDAFYHVPVLIEAEGGPLVPLLLDAVAAAERGDTAFVTNALRSSAETLTRMGQHLPKLFSTLDVGMFYHKLRPFLGGGKGMEEKGLPRGMVFKRSDGLEQVVKCIGGSAAQSSLFQFLDYVLGVEHRPSGDRSETIFQEMRQYMPRKHREFLEIVSKLPSIRSFVQKKLSDEVLGRSYDDCMKQLRLWRGKHIAIVSKYIVQPARLAEDIVQNGQAEVDGFEAAKGEQLQGTGGSALIPFLRQSRDETVGVQSPESAIK
ncbi:indoleamine 2,3-dioxygenase subfamily [Dactylonectria macrodidyma]|uniref:Indoleamine 2,3-dioxygenase subfamily n=1 Tax=Dactylonectria macrodidyma TaxID=307937 RepID=A0A9P9FFJ2_9HYPO|nr:indoleamine 2,3-dioxygenase subfamily [Dactylonectria macrodidyma]